MEEYEKNKININFLSWGWWQRGAPIKTIRVRKKRKKNNMKEMKVNIVPYDPFKKKKTEWERKKDTRRLVCYKIYLSITKELNW